MTGVTIPRDSQPASRAPIRSCWTTRITPRQRSSRPVWLTLALFICIGLPSRLVAQGSLTKADLSVIRGTPLQEDYREMLFKYLLQRADVATEQRLAGLRAIKSDADLKDWQNTKRRKFLELIGGLPAERTPLNAHIVGEIRREGYVVRKVIFESLPGFYVTANLYVPTTGKGPYPAVLSPCGHTRNGKADEVYQHLFIGFVKRGYVVLTYDAPGQGERIQYWDFLTGQRGYQFRSNEHGLYGVQEYLLGQNLARYMIWDGIRALDYLTDLPEVDPSRIGVTGNSGGGALTTYIAALDPRVKLAAPVTFICSFPKKIEARTDDAESDPEQDVQGLLAEGIDHTEELGMIAPRPVLIGAATRDFFPIAGTRQTYKELQQVYAKLGVPEHVKMVEFDHEHMYSQSLREAAYAWFDRWLRGVEDLAHEPPITPEKDQMLECTPTGQVVTSLGGYRIQDFNRAEAERLGAAIARRRGTPLFRDGLLTSIRQSLALPMTQPPPHAKGIGEVTVGGLTIEKLLLETEPGIVVPLRVIFSKRSAEPFPTVLYLHDRDGSQDNPEVFENLTKAGRVVVVADVRGFGETMSHEHVLDTRIGYFHPRDAMDADFSYASLFLGRPLLGMRVWDALQVIAYLRSRPEVDPLRITLAGQGWAGLIAVFTGALNPAVSAVAVESVPVSYTQMAVSEEDVEPVSLMLPGVLQHFDLTDVFEKISPRPLLVLNPTDARTATMSQDEARVVLNLVRHAYRSAEADGALEIRVEPFEVDAREALKAWILSH
jgi:cephalosporin-C deacetylase-like acetyl esterase